MILVAVATRHPNGEQTLVDLALGQVWVWAGSVIRSVFRRNSSCSLLLLTLLLLLESALHLLQMAMAASRITSAQTRAPPPDAIDDVSHRDQAGGGKADRMAAQSAKIQAGHVHLPRCADWLDCFLLELLAFPNGKYDDQVDSVSQFLKWTGRRRFENFIEVKLPFTGREPGSDDGSEPSGLIIGVY